MIPGLRSALAVLLAVPFLVALASTAATPSSAEGGATPAPASSVIAVAPPAASPSAAASPVASWSHLPPVPPTPAPTEAEKKGQELTIYYTSNIIGEIDPCG